MKDATVLEKKRQALLKELGAIRALRKGYLNEQWFPAIREGKKTKELRGPYFVWTRKVGKKTVSERVRGAAAVERARQDEANYKRFKELCREYEAVAHQLGVLERQSASEEALKKGRRSRSNKAGKSRAS